MIAAVMLAPGSFVASSPLLAAETTAAAQQPNAETTRTQLRAKIDEANRVPEAPHDTASWTAMRSAMNDARDLAGNASASAAELAAATAKLQTTIGGLQPRVVVPFDGPRLGLSASHVATSREGPVNHVALRWAATDAWDLYEIYRRPAAGGEAIKIYSGRGASFHDYGLPEGAFVYRLIARRNNGESLSSNIAEIATMALPASAQEYSNQTGTGAQVHRPLKIGDTYWRFDMVTGPGRRILHFIARTSKDGINWEDGPIVLDQNSHPDLRDCKLEALSFIYDEVRDRVVWWCHWEVSGSSYAHGKALVASAKPGEPFTVHHVYTPLGIQVRDMSLFIDDDKQGYLVAASNVPGQGANSTLYIFKLNEDYTDAAEVVIKLLDGMHREAPHILKREGIYYLFFSESAGWYPSRAGYLSSRSLSGGWSELRPIANTSTFSAQSGGLQDFGTGQRFAPVFMPNRWVRGEGTSRNVMIPISLVDGFAFGDYSSTLLVDRDSDLIVPLHAGRLLSQDRPVVASIPGMPGHEPEKAFDGDYYTFFRSETRNWPFTVDVDLGTPSQIRNVQISWHIHKGSEAYYKYTIEGSDNGREWRVLLDRTDDSDTTVSRTYGFTSDLLPDAPTARHLRINVHRAVLHNNPNNWYPPTLYEVKVFGDRATGRR
jgi:hypothetical protein